MELTTFQFLSTIMEKEKSAFLSPDYLCIIISKLTDDKLYWIKLYHVITKLTIQEVDKILYRKKQGLAGVARLPRGASDF